jgi:uncharacterized protein
MTTSSGKPTDIYQLSARTPAGQETPLSNYKGKVVLVVNTATECGLTPQFEGLERLYNEYKDRGLVVLGFPCNQFAGQEPVTNENMEQVCKVNFGVSFPLFEKIEVNGDHTHPLFKFLKSKLSGGLFGRRIKWNFTKFLVDRQGRPIKRFSPVTKPDAIEPWIKSLLSVLFALVCFIPKGNAQAGDATKPGDDIVIGKTEKIYSSQLKEERTIWVHIPQSYHKDKDSTRRYPVLYLMDGNDHFTSVVGLVQRLGEASGNDICPDMIVVGILNTDRTRDLTPSHVAAGPYLNASMVKTTGGGEAFMAFLAKELIPHIDSTCPASPYRLLVGHSLGGLMVVDALFHHRELFSAYLAIDPSLWWDDQKLLKQAESELGPGSFRNTAFFLGIANTMQTGMDTSQVKMDTARNSIHIRSILRFESDLQKAKNSGLRWDYKYYPADTHGSVPLIAEYDALRFLFSFYHFPEQNQLFDSACSADSAVRMITLHYRIMTERMGYAILPPQGLVNSMGHNFLQNKMPDKAFAFFTLNIENYPKSVDAYANMGDYYAAREDKRKALEYYNRALVIGDNPDWVKEKIEKLNAGDHKPSH